MAIVMGALATIKFRYRVSPFYADDTVRILTPSISTGRCLCAAVDVEATASGRRYYAQLATPARDGWLDEEGLLPIFAVGQRVEISPSCDLWIRGAKYGRIHSIARDWTIAVRMDHPRVRKLQRFTAHSLLTMEFVP